MCSASHSALKGKARFIRSLASPAALETTHDETMKPNVSNFYLFEGKNMFCPVYFQNNLAQSLAYHEFFFFKLDK